MTPGAVIVSGDLADYCRANAIKLLDALDAPALDPWTLVDVLSLTVSSRDNASGQKLDFSGTVSRPE
jgi:hypothetical protein